MSKTLNLVEAATSYILSLEQSIVTDYQIGNFVFHSYILKKYGEQNIRLQKKLAQKTDYNRLIQKLIDQNIISPLNEFPHQSVFNIINKPHVSNEEIMCLLDPFAYISHLSAMIYHGFLHENKIINQSIILSSYPIDLWRKQALIIMENNCRGKENFKLYTESGLPRLRKMKLKKINRIKIIEYNNKNIEVVKTKRIRVSTVPRTFLDMLRKPDLCGGINLVLDVYKEHALNFLASILKEIDSNGTKIEKVRAGYILEEICKVKNTIVESWLEHVQRGSSRKLDPSKNFSSVYSDRWCISLNC